MITRKEALEAKLGQYTTGQPCKYGHMSPRYTQSGTCVQCVLDASRKSANNSKLDLRQRNDAQREQKATEIGKLKRLRTEALRDLIEVRLLINDQDKPLVFDTAVHLCLGSYPCLEDFDVRPNANGVDKGSPIYKVLIPAPHVDLIRGIANELWRVHRQVDPTAIRAGIITLMEQEADDEADTPPEGHM